MLAKSSEVFLPSRHDNRRRYERIFEAEKQLYIIVNDRKLVTSNWSISGCLVDALQEWKVGDTVAATLESHQGSPKGAIISEIIRIDDQGRAALRFTILAPLL